MLLSVIVPVYNAEKYLKRCIDSILLQQHTDFELLLIDDGSTDSSKAICYEYARKDSRIRVFHKANGGVSSARNLGLDNVQGDWICFVDSDDCVSEFYLSNLLSHAHDVDLVISYAEYVYSDNTHRKEVYTNRNITNNYDVLFAENDLNWHTSPWAKLFKKDLCADLRFIEGMHIGEDLVFLYTYLIRCNKISVSNDTDYFYYVETQFSLTKRVNHLKEELLSYRNVCRCVRELINAKQIRNPRALSKLDWIIAYYVRRVLNAIYYDGENRTFKHRIENIKSLDTKRYAEYIERSSYKERVYTCLLKWKLYGAYDVLRMFIKSVRG